MRILSTELSQLKRIAIINIISNCVCKGCAYLQKSFHKPIFDILNRLDIDKKGHKIKASPFGDEH